LTARSSYARPVPVQLAAAAWERLNDSTMDNTAIATFFDGYVRSLLQAIVDDDMSEWRAYLHPEFLWMMT